MESSTTRYERILTGTLTYVKKTSKAELNAFCIQCNLTPGVTGKRGLVTKEDPQSHRKKVSNVSTEALPTNGIDIRRLSVPGSLSTDMRTFKLENDERLLTRESIL